MLMLETLQKIVTLASCISRFVLAKLDPVIARCAPAWSPPRVPPAAAHLDCEQTILETNPAGDVDGPLESIGRDQQRLCLVLRDDLGARGHPEWQREPCGCESADAGPLARIHGLSDGPSKRQRMYRHPTPAGLVLLRPPGRADPRRGR